MRKTIRLTAEDGHTLDAYKAEPEGEQKGAVVVVQEVFGVNGHIRDVCDRFAAHGYAAVAPALFDRVRRGVELDYDEAGIAEGRELAAAVGWDDPVTDIRTAAGALRPDGRVGVVGYCWGGSWAWMAACRLDVAAAACYYGRHIVDLLDERPRCPVILHFGADDPTIPAENVAKIRAAFPDIPINVYDGAGHGFNCDRRKDFRPDAARAALDHTLALFAEQLR
ncbi:MAG: dienelactone hydrolase family protein [Rhodospirillales bacterium]|nr:dienelactone hydrolase family protein [Rhodospirillales bacterium]